MKDRHSIRSVLTTGGPLVLVALAWLFLAPRPLGGPVSYVVTEGISMKPRLNAGDLVIVRESDDYEVGDVVAFNSPSLGVVLHRIIGLDGDRYVFKGDNNDFIDQDRPREEDLLGKEMLVVPQAGKALGWVGNPLNAALFAGAVGLLVLSGLGVRRATEKRPSSQPDWSVPSLRGDSKRPIQIAGGALALMAVGAALLFGLPDQRTAESDASYTHSGTYGYSGRAERSPVYPHGRVNTGQPIFLNLVDELDVRFDYEFVASSPHRVQGVAELKAEITDSNGWSRAFVLDDPSRFQGRRASVEGPLDLTRLRKLVTKIQRLTGVQEPFYTVSLTPRIKIEGEIEGAAFDAEFAPPLSFELDNLRMKPVRPPLDPLTEQPTNALEPTEEGSVQVPSNSENALGVGGLSVSVQTARWVLVAGGILAALALVLLLMSQPGHDDAEVEAILRQLSGRIVNVSSISATAERKAIEMSSIEDLVEIADRYGRVILHDYQDRIHSFIVEEDGIAYWYQVLDPKGPRVQASNVARLDAQRPSEASPVSDIVSPGTRSR